MISQPREQFFEVIALAQFLMVEDAFPEGGSGDAKFGLAKEIDGEAHALKSLALAVPHRRTAEISNPKFQNPKTRRTGLEIGFWNLGFAKLGLQRRSPAQRGEGGWPTGLEPATTRTTIWSSTIELRPPNDSGI